MKWLILTLAIIVSSFLPGTLYSQAKINNGVNVSVTAEVPTWTQYSYNNYANPYSMDDFNDGQNYKIDITETPVFVSSYQMAVGGTVQTSGATFEWENEWEFSLHYVIPANTAPGQVGTFKFKISKKILGVWNFQTTFFYDVYTSCVSSKSFPDGIINILAGIDYEVSDVLTVAAPVTPGNAITELDAGSSVILQPGFVSNVTSSGGILIVNDGCGGAFRPSNSEQSIVTAMSEYEQSDNFQVYPNPFATSFIINIPDNFRHEKLILEVMDITGRKIAVEVIDAENEKTELNTVDFEKGVYLIILRNEKHVLLNKKIVKN